MKKKKSGLEGVLLHTRDSMAGIEKLAKSHWARESSRTALKVIRETAVRTVKLIERALRRRRKDG